MTDSFNNFINTLAAVEFSNSIFNQYSYQIPANLIRRKNLQLYLQYMNKLQPKILLVGEAPGYRGCRLTGVPFTSEFILLNGITQLQIFGESQGYCKTNESDKLCKEAIASILWETLATLKQVPLLWNAFPFHPFQVGNQQSNRKPLKSELEVGSIFLEKMIKMFAIERVIALGNTAEATLKSLNVSHSKVRHPSYGGKRQFQTGILSKLV